MQGINNADQQYQAMIIRMQRLAAGYGGGGSGAGNYEYLTDFTVGAGGGAPEDGSTDYANPSIIGDIKIHKNGTGYLTEGVNYNLTEGGGFELIGGAVFSTDEKYTIFKVIT